MTGNFVRERRGRVASLETHEGEVTQNTADGSDDSTDWESQEPPDAGRD